MHEYPHVYIDGAWVAPSGSGTLEVIDSATERSSPPFPPATPPTSTAPSRRPRPRSRRGRSSPPRARQVAVRVAEALEARRDEIADMITHEVGMPKPLSAAIQVGTGISAFSAAAELADTFEFEDRSNGLVVREPDRRRRLHHAVELPAQPDRGEGRVHARRRLHRRAEAVGGRAGQRVRPRRDHRRHRVPARGVQPRDRLGPVVGEALAAHPDVDMVSFTGSTRAASGWPSSPRNR